MDHAGRAVFPLLLAASTALLMVGCAALPDIGAPFRWLRIGSREDARERVERALLAGVAVRPEPLVLSRNRRVLVEFRVTNRSGDPVHLEFPGEQRFDVEVADASGRAVARWSEDRPFAAEPAYATVNPGEGLVYSALLPTREMKPGQPYSVEAYLVGYGGVKARKLIVPVR